MRIRRVLKWVGIVLGVTVLIVGGLGAYIYSYLPTPVDPLPPLEQALFRAPATRTPVAGRYIFKSASELAAMIRERQATSTEIVAEHLAYIRNDNRRLNALVWLREKDAMSDARAADEAVARGAQLGPLHGVPITIKEMYGVKGLPLTLNAKMFGLISKADAPIVRALTDAGAIVLGTTNVPYLLSDYQTAGEIYPTGNNPYDVARTPGGSTGGGAAAVAAGFSTLELGSDLGGSVRVPAAFCGLWGFKATMGGLNITEGTNPAPSLKFTRLALASPGLLTRTADDLALGWRALKTTVPDPAFQAAVTWRPGTARALSAYRIAWSDRWSEEDQVPVSTIVRARLRSFVDAIRTKGAPVEERSPGHYKDLLHNFFATFALMNAEGQPWLLRKLMAYDLVKLAPDDAAATTIRTSLADGSDSAWQRVQRERRTLRDAWDTFFTEHDVFISPVTYGPAFRHLPSGSSVPGDTGTVGYFSYVGYAPVINAIGAPTISVPLGLDDHGLPIGVQVIGPQFSDEDLVHFATLIAPLVPGYVRPSGFGPNK